MLKFLHYRRAFISYLRGFFVTLLSSQVRAKGLRIEKNVKLTGTFKFGKNVFLSDNVIMYHNIIIDDDSYIGDNVEFRCHSSVEIRIGKKCTVNKNSILIGKVEIGNDVMVAPDCNIIGARHNFSESKMLIREQGIERKGVVIEDNVWLGAKVIVLDGVSIGTGSVIGAGSVVTKSIPSYSIAVGNPCKVVKKKR